MLWIGGSKVEGVQLKSRGKVEHVQTCKSLEILVKNLTDATV